VTNSDNSIDLVAMALQLGATFVARSFSGDKTQMVPLIKAAIEHEGAAFIDIVSPCVAFNNHAGSTKSFDYVREHNEAVTGSISSPAARRSRWPTSQVRWRSSSSTTARNSCSRKWPPTTTRTTGSAP
jgi:pyruvate/2-oxoacid:ferredoxin oxidoreductase beta subunit